VLASAEKLNAASPYLVVDLTEVTGIITERSVNDTLVTPYADMGLSVVRA
jgi:DeoR/GlpR family transcriptional regulator of sugar metabolism